VSWRRRLERIVRPLAFAHFRMKRGLTLGVRGMIVDAEGRVLLIEHTYVPGWYLPGGGVEHGETAEEALARELVEEVGVRVEGRPKLVSAHSNHSLFPNDHVLIYRIDDWTPCPATSRGEIAQMRWFKTDALPDGVTAGTRRRIEEAFSGGAVSPHW
jgi:8-oxo-dGTP pyrophosphatase MutT (NUDIX family)